MWVCCIRESVVAFIENNLGGSTITQGQHNRAPTSWPWLFVGAPPVDPSTAVPVPSGPPGAVIFAVRRLMTASVYLTAARATSASVARLSAMVTSMLGPLLLPTGAKIGGAAGGIKALKLAKLADAWSISESGNARR